MSPIEQPFAPPPPPKPLVDPLPDSYTPPIQPQQQITAPEPPPSPLISFPPEMQQTQFTLNPENFAQLGTRVDSIEERLGKLGTTLDSQFSPRSQMGIGSYGAQMGMGGFGSPYGFSPYSSMGFSSPFASSLYGGIGQYFPFF
jgi:hypothetical protein|tara:strand:- start:2698 stop:3126 length:429 start_codon:yes stop_codon:yes gene_type:complete